MPPSAITRSAPACASLAWACATSVRVTSPTSSRSCAAWSWRRTTRSLLRPELDLRVVTEHVHVGGYRVEQDRLLDRLELGAARIDAPLGRLDLSVNAPALVDRRDGREAHAVGRDRAAPAVGNHAVRIAVERPDIACDLDRGAPAGQLLPAPPRPRPAGALARLARQDCSGRRGRVPLPGFCAAALPNCTDAPTTSAASTAKAAILPVVESRRSQVMGRSFQ